MLIKHVFKFLPHVSVSVNKCAGKMEKLKAVTRKYRNMILKNLNAGKTFCFRYCMCDKRPMFGHHFA